MSEAKYTKGPWEVDEHSHVYGAGSKMETFKNKQGEEIANRSRLIALPYGCDGGSKEGNARLIAAAPELLEALTELLKHAGIADADPSDIDGEDHARESKARAAISAAKGE